MISLLDPKFLQFKDGTIARNLCILLLIMVKLAHCCVFCW